MSTSAITLLKVLLHGDMHIDELGKYMKLDANSIERNVTILNRYLREKGMKTVKKMNNIYSLENKDERFSDFFSKLDILSSEQRQNILCTKLLLNGYINLEKEREKLGISRTTAIKDLKVVKEQLLKSDIFLESKNSKGIFIQTDEESKVNRILCENLIRLFVDRDFLCMQRKELLEEVNILDEEKYIKIYKEITDVFKIRKSIIAFYAIYSLALIEKHKGFLEIRKKEKNDKEIEIEKILEKTNLAKSLSDNIKEKVAEIVLKTKCYKSSDSVINKQLNIFIDEVKEKFKMCKLEAKRLEESIANYFIMGYVDKKYGVLWVRKKPHSLRCQKLANVIESILDKIKLEMMYSDVLRLSGSISNFFLDEQHIKGFKVLSVSRNLDEEQNYKVIKCMKELYPGLNFESESLLDFRFRSEDNILSYDLIISDTESYKIKNLVKVNSLSVKEIQRCFIEYVLDKRFESAGII
ncbi:hypothetical protein [Cetobacterium sp.]|uniref:hypothetical protein n=1 Tax=Cetobacterium sp. TaxID=2071632 RepID=UPI003F348FF3